MSRQGGQKATGKPSSATALGRLHNPQIVGSELLLNSLQLDQVVMPQTGRLHQSFCEASILSMLSSCSAAPEVDGEYRALTTQ